MFRMVTSPVRNLQRFAMRGLFGKMGITEKPPYVGLTRRVPSRSPSMKELFRVVFRIANCEVPLVVHI